MNVVINDQLYHVDNDLLNPVHSCNLVHHLIQD
jgi:hypothetical protein